MKTTSAILFKLCLINFLFSCNPTANDKASATTYALEIVDSVQVDFLGNLDLYAVHSTKDLFLFHDYSQKIFILTDQSGEVLSTFDQPGDAPTSFGNFPCAATFIGDTIAVLGPQKLVTYNLDFEFITGHKKPYAGKGMIYSGYDHLQKANIAGEKNLVAFTGGPQHAAASNEAAYYANFNTFDLINLDSGGFKPIIPLHPKSRYFQGEAFNFIRPMFQVNDNQLHFVFATDTLFHTYDLSQQKNRISIEGIAFDYFILNPEYPMGGSENYDTPKSKAGMVEAYFNLDGKGLILYRSGLSRENFPVPETATREEWNEIDARLNPLKFLVRESEGTYSNTGLCPPLFTPTHVDGKNRLWARQHVELLEHEPEFYTIYQVELVPQ